MQEHDRADVAMVAPQLPGTRCAEDHEDRQHHPQEAGHAQYACVEVDLARAGRTGYRFPRRLPRATERAASPRIPGHPASLMYASTSFESVSSTGTSIMSDEKNLLAWLDEDGQAMTDTS